MNALLAAALAAAAVSCWLAPSSRTRLRRGQRGSFDQPQVHRRRVGVLPIVTAAGLVGAGGVWASGLPRAGVLSTMGVVAAAAVMGLVLRHAEAAAVRRRRTEVARAASTLAVQLRAGVVATEALASAAEDWPVLQAAARTQQLGGDPAEVWLLESRRPGLRGLADLSRGWRLCARSGAPLAPALERIAEALATEDGLGLTVTAELAAPRATARIMAVLPLVGLGIGFALGGDPVRFLLDTTTGRTCLLTGTLLAAAGVAWIEWIAGRVAKDL